MNNRDPITAALLGTAVGDALGLPAEGLSRDAIARLGWNHWRHRLVFGRGMLSDDTEHALYTARCLIEADGDPDRFGRCLAWRLRWWLLGLPAGIGLATGRAIFKLWLGFPPRLSGVFSAGNGPAMRSPVIGAAYAGDPARMRQMVERSTRLTHSDPKALVGALAVAQAAAWASHHPTPQASPERREAEIIPDKLVQQWQELDTNDAEWQRLLDQLKRSLLASESMQQFADHIDQSRGVSGYIYHTVPVALYAWLRHRGDFAATLTRVLDLGGDTDTVGAITGALAAISAGQESIPREWLDGIIDYPRTPKLIRRTGEALSARLCGEPDSAPRYAVIAVFPRNLLFLIIVLSHGFLRLLPASLRRRIIP